MAKKLFDLGKFITFNLAFCIFLAACPVSSQQINKNQDNSISGKVDTSKYPLVSNINDVNRNKPVFFSIKAFVIDIYNCPPCPEGAMCKPCMGDNVTISDTVSSGNSSNTNLRVFIKNQEQFQLNKKYFFALKLTKLYSDNDTELVSYEPIDK